MIQPMRYGLFLGVVLSFWANSALASPSTPPAGSPSLLCQMAIVAAERGGGVPPNLLAAIARVESGRRDPLTGVLHPWPWTVNVEGEGSYYNTKAEAVAAVGAMQARGIRSIDVGCMQVNLMHHPAAFPSLDLAFEPQVNAAYAARFLKVLFARSGDWSKAAGLYHSATPELSADYTHKVLAVWPEEARGPVASPPRSLLAQAWAATLPAAPAPGPALPQSGPQLGHTSGGHKLMLPTTEPGSSPGRDLDAYRAAPTRLAHVPPRRPRM